MSKEVLQRIEDKVAQLGERLERTRQDNRRLQHENEQLAAQLAQQRESVDVLKTKLAQAQQRMEQNAELSLAGGMSSDPSHSRQLKDQLDAYIHELDEVIDWLKAN